MNIKVGDVVVDAITGKRCLVEDVERVKTGKRGRPSIHYKLNNGEVTFVVSKKEVRKASKQEAATPAEVA